MWQYFIAKNFRCFGGVFLKDLARVNLIAGMNNTGKTALLEAMHIHSFPFNANIPFSVHAQRGLGLKRSFSDDVGSWLFLDKHLGQVGTEFICQEDDGRTRSLRMWLLDTLTTRQRFPEADKMLQESFIESARREEFPRLIMETEADGRKTFAVGIPTGRGLTSVGRQQPWRGLSVYIGARGRSRARDLRTFSELEADKRLDELLPALRVIEPRVTKLSLLLLAGSPAVHADVGLRHLVPMQMMGDGIGRLLSFLLAISSAENGRVLIDEVENGLHYSVLTDIWRAIGVASRRANVQVFATTHSWECIRAAHEAFSDDETYDFRLHRLERRNGDVQAVTYDREMIDAALLTGLEMR